MEHSPSSLLHIIRKEADCVKVLRKAITQASKADAEKYRKQIEQHENQIAIRFAELQEIDETEGQRIVQAAEKIIN